MAAKFTKRLVVLVTPDDHQWLQDHASDETLEVSDIVRRAIRIYRRSTQEQRHETATR